MTTEDRDVARDAAKVADLFGWFADHDFHDHSPLYEHLARQIATDDVIPTLVTLACRESYAPILFLASVRYLALCEPESGLAAAYDSVLAGTPPSVTDIWPQVRSLALDRGDEIDELMRTRYLQTNEVGRSAALRPALAAVAQLAGREVGLVEIGASAGLNLFVDRFHIDYGAAGAAGPAESGVRLRCEVRGPLVPPFALDPHIGSRQGIDRRPVDVLDPDARRWLRACVWPDVPGRLERFDAALAVASADPPRVVEGDAVAVVAEAIASVPAHQQVCLVSTWALAYFDEDQKAALEEQVAHAARTRPVAYVTAEYERVVPWLPSPPRGLAVDDGVIPTLVGLGWWPAGGRAGEERHRILAWTHAHAAWLDWVDESTAASAS
jgi:hypothetical protein